MSRSISIHLIFFFNPSCNKKWNLLLVKALILKACLPRQNDTKGGNKETEVKESAVKPNSNKIWHYSLLSCCNLQMVHFFFNWSNWIFAPLSPSIFSTLMTLFLPTLYCSLVDVSYSMCLEL